MRNIPRVIALLLAVTAVAATSVAVAAPASAQSLFERLNKATGGLTDRLGSGGGAAALTDDEIGRGLREALRVGTERLVGRLGATDGFNGDPQVRIPLPDSLQRVQATLQRFGLSGMADDLELRLNRAAEAATPKAKELFFDAIGAMTLTDARQILNGPQDSATEYFRGRMSSPLKAEFRPIVDGALDDAGAVRAYDSLMGSYRALPFVPDVKADLTDHVLERAVAGIFFYLGREEAEIRENPARRTTELLKKVFGG